MLIAGDLLGLSKTSAHRAIHSVMCRITELHDQYIFFPANLDQIKHKFFLKSGMRQFIGAIDCTHIKIQSPGRQIGETFRNRKGFFSINVQAVCDTELNFMDVVVQWPGPTHDSRIFSNSRLKLRFDENSLDGRLFGDAGYPLLPYLITPYPTQNANPAKRRFNRVHSAARMAIEKAFGCLKRRFPALKTEVRLSDPVDICTLIHSAFILHNMCRRHNDNADDFFEQIENYDQQMNEPVAAPPMLLPDLQEGTRIRDELCEELNN